MCSLPIIVSGSKGKQLGVWSPRVVDQGWEYDNGVFATGTAPVRRFVSLGDDLVSYYHDDESVWKRHQTSQGLSFTRVHAAPRVMPHSVLAGVTHLVIMTDTDSALLLREKCVTGERPFFVERNTTLPL